MTAPLFPQDLLGQDKPRQKPPATPPPAPVPTFDESAAALGIRIPKGGSVQGQPQERPSEYDAAASNLGIRAPNPALARDSVEDVQPASAARALKLSYETGVPAGVALADLDEYEKRERRRRAQLEYVPGRHPGLDSWIVEKPERAAAVRDEMPQLMGVYGRLETIGGPSLPSRVYKNLETGFQRSELTTRASVIASEAAARGGDEYLPADKAAELKSINERLQSTHEGKNWFDYSQESAGEFLGFIAGVTGTGLVGGLVGGLAAVAAGASLAAAAPAALAVAGVVGMARIFQIEGGAAWLGQSELEAQTGIKIPYRQKLTSSVGYGVVATALERLGLKYVGSQATGAFRKVLARPSALKLLGDIGVPYVTAIATETGTEVSQEISQAIWMEISKVSTSSQFETLLNSEEEQDALLSRLVEVAKATSSGMLWIGVPGASAHTASAIAGANRAQRRHSQLVQLGEEVRSLNLAKQAPAEIGALAEHASPDLVLHFDAPALQTFFQQNGYDDRAVMADILGSPEAYEAALRGRSTVAIPMPTYLTKVSMTPIAGFMESEARFGSPEEQNLRESRETIANAERIAPEVLAADRELAVIADALEQQITDTGRYRPEQVQALLQPMVSSIRVLSNRAGLTPKAWFDANVATVSAGKEEDFTGSLIDELVSLGQPRPEALPVLAGPARITAAAMRYESGAIYTAPTHWEAHEKAVAAGEEDILPAEEDQGYASGSGQFLDREAASEVAEAAGVSPLDEEGLPVGAEDLLPRLRQSELEASRLESELVSGLVSESEIGHAQQLAGGLEFKTNREFKELLQGRVNSKARDLGVDLTDLDDPRTRRYLRDVALSEAKRAMETNLNAIGWYGEKVSAALAVMGLVYPELNSSEDARFTFIYALAVTSNGIEVDENFSLADRVYGYFKSNGKMPTNFGQGTAAQAMDESFETYNRLASSPEGLEELQKLMLSEFTASELSKMGFPVDELAAETVRGAAILGPKIGNGFFSNLMGFFDQLTIDRWLMRTWGRWTGSLIEYRPEAVARLMSQLGSKISELLSDEAASAALESALGATIPSRQTSGDEGTILTASMIWRQSTKPEFRELINAIKLSNGSEIGADIRKLSNSLIRNIDGQKEAPKNSTERKVMRDVFKGVLLELQESVPALTMADLQALLWYPERLLYSKAKASTEETVGSYADDEAPDYANAAISLALSKNITKRRIDNVVAKAIARNKQDVSSAGRAGATRRGDVELEASDTGAEGVRHVLAGAERKGFVLRHVIRNYRSDSGYDGRTPKAYLSKGEGSRKSVRLLGKKVGIKQEFKKDRKAANSLAAVGAKMPSVLELDSSPEGVGVFFDAINQGKASNKFGASVYVYPQEEYASMRLFLTEDGSSGFALKGTDIVSVFGPQRGGSGNALMILAVEQGGRKLDAFDTVLPTFYFNHGFVEAARRPWNEEFKPDDWDKETFRDFNNGEPDVVFMVFDPRANAVHTKARTAKSDNSAYSAQLALERKFAEIPVKSGEQTLFQRESDSFVGRLYSRVEKAIESAPFNKGTVKQWRAHLAANASEVERVWSGLERFFEDAGEDRVLTREDIRRTYLDYAIEIGETVQGRVPSDQLAALDLDIGAAEASLRQDIEELVWPLGQGVSSFSQLLGEPQLYTDKKKRDLALTTSRMIEAEVLSAARGEPGRGSLAADIRHSLKASLSRPADTGEVVQRRHEFARRVSDIIMHAHFPGLEELHTLKKAGSQVKYSDYTIADVEDQRNVLLRLLSPDFTHKTTHWEEDDIIAHIRMGDIKLRSVGDAVLVIEMQSDAAQAAREHGVTEGTEGGDESTVAKVQDFPFKQTSAWVELALKRVIDEAVATGKAAVVLPTGSQVSKMFSLGRRFDAVTYLKLTNGQYAVSGYRGGLMIATTTLEQDQLVPYLGEENAAMVLDGEGEPDPEDSGRTLLPLDVNAPSKGMVAFYDDIVIRTLQKYFKSLKLPLDTFLADIGSGDGAANTAILITPALRAKIQAEGQRLMQSGAGVAGAITFDPSERGTGARKFNIKILETGDVSTVLHEWSHYLFEVMQDMSSTEDAPLGIREDFEKLLAFAGGESGIALTEEQHERLASAMETYFREGKAPSAELRSAFAKIKLWMGILFRVLKGRGVEINDEVRGVFDRMFASEDAIAEAEEAAIVTPLFANAEEAGISEVLFEEYRSKVEEAHSEAVVELQARLLSDFEKEKSAWWSEEREKERALVSEEVYSMPDQAALRFLALGVKPDGTKIDEPIKLSREGVVEIRGASFLSRLPGRGRLSVYGKEGVHPDLVAPMIGYATGAELLDAIAAAQDPKKLIEAETDKKMRSKHGDMLTDGRLPAEAMEAVLSEARKQVVIAEMKMLRKLARENKPALRAAQLEAREAAKVAKTEFKEGVESIIQSAREEKLEDAARAREALAAIPSLRTVNEAAARALSGVRIMDISPHTYWSTARREQRASVAAMAKGDYAKALEHQRVHLTNLAMYREATLQLEIAEKLVREARGLDKPKVRTALAKAGQEYVDAIDQLLERYDFRQINLGEVRERLTMAAFLEAEEEKGHHPNLPEWVKNATSRIPWKTMTIEQVVDVVNAGKQIKRMALFSNRLIAEQDRADLRELVSLLSEEVKKNAKSVRKRTSETRLQADRLKYKFEEALAAHLKFSYMVRELDGFVDGGPLWEALVRPLNAAADVQSTMTSEAVIALDALFKKHYTKGELAVMDRRNVKSSVELFTKQAVLMMALNWGAQDNRVKLLDGLSKTHQRVVSETEIESTLAHLDERDWRFVEEVWGLLDSYWPQIKELSEELDGIAVERVEPTAFKNRFGREIRGGYFPLIYDNRQDSKIAQQEEKALASSIVGGMSARNATKAGSRNARVKSSGRPLRLDFGVINQHLSEILLDISHTRALFDVSRILRSEELQSTIRSHYGDPYLKALNAHVKSLAVRDIASAHAGEEAVGYLRKGVTVSILGWKLMTAAIQPLGLTQSWSRIGLKWVALGVRDWVGGAARMENVYEKITTLSPFMANRGRTQMREIAEIRNSILLGRGKVGRYLDMTIDKATLGTKDLKDVQDTYFWFITRMQLVADIPTWLGAYQKTLAEDPADEAKAVAVADQAVRDSQGGGEKVDLAAVQRGSESWKLFTNFYSFFSSTFNEHYAAIKRTDRRSISSVGRLGVDLMVLSVVPAMLNMLLRDALKGEDDDDEEFLRRLAREEMSYLLGTVVLLREMSGVVQGYRGYEGPAGTRFWAELGKAGSAVAAGGSLSDAGWRALNNSSGILFHYPSSQVQATVGGLMSLYESPRTPITAPFFGPPRNR